MTTSIPIIWKPLSSMTQTNDENCYRIVKKLLFSYTELEIEGIDFATFVLFLIDILIIIFHKIGIDLF